MRFPGLKLTARVGGAAKMAAHFKQTDAILQREVRAEVAKAAKGIQELTSFIAPKDTGYMASVVRVDILDDGLAAEVGWHEADFIAFGLPNYYEFQEHGTSRQPAQPSLGPAFNIIAPEHAKRLRKILQDAAARAA